MLLKFVNYPRLVLYRYSSLGYIYDGINRGLVSKTSKDNDDISSFIYIFEALRYLNLELGTGTLILPSSRILVNLAPYLRHRYENLNVA